MGLWLEKLIYSIVLVIQGHFQVHLQGHKMSNSRSKKWKYDFEQTQIAKEV